MIMYVHFWFAAAPFNEYAQDCAQKQFGQQGLQPASSNSTVFGQSFNFAGVGV